MPRYIIERNLPGAGALSPDELQAIARRRPQASSSVM
jgi:hypothetical protein